MPPTAIRPHTARTVGLLLFSILAVATGVGLLIEGGRSNYITGAILVVFFGLGTVMFFGELFGEPWLIISDEGLKMGGDRLLLWSEVDHVRERVHPTAGDPNFKVIEVVLRDPHTYTANLSGAAAEVTQDYMAHGFSPYYIPGRARERESILAAMRRHHPGLVVTS